MKGKPLSILQELESDDELPDNYNDMSILPAYLDNHRFDSIQFPWLNHVSLSSEDTKPKNHFHQQEILCHKGVLKGQDIYCLKSVESFTSSSTLMWFVNFLLRKDLQSHYSYLKGCLVADFISSVKSSKSYVKCENSVFEDRFEIVVKI